MTTARMTTKPTSKRYEGWWSKQLFHAFGYTVLILIGLFLFMPVFWLLVNALKVDSEFFTYPVHLFPAAPQWSNYVKIFTMTRFMPVATRTAALAISTALIGTFVSAMGGFAFSRYQVKGSKELFSIVIALMIVPGIVLLIPQFILYARLKLTEPGPGAIHFPRRLDADYFRQLTAERVVTRFERGRPIRSWQPKRDGERNEALDTFVYAHAALHGLISMGLRLNEEADAVMAAGRKGEALVAKPASAPVIRSAWMGPKPIDRT